MCLKGSINSFISPSSGGSLGPVNPICAQRWPKTTRSFIHFLPYESRADYGRWPKYETRVLSPSHSDMLAQVFPMLLPPMTFDGELMKLYLIWKYN